MHADSGINGPRDFVGKKIGYQAGQDTSTIYEAMMGQLGLDRNAVTEVPVKYDFTPFLTRQIDVWPGYTATQAYVLEREKIAYRAEMARERGISVPALRSRAFHIRKCVEMCVTKCLGFGAIGSKPRETNPNPDHL